MDPRAEHLVTALGLTPHPEGGYFTEVFRSPAAVRPDDGRPARAALTIIYFLLTEGEVSRWHRVASDEAWHFLEGDPLEIVTADPSFETLSRHLLGPLAEGVAPICTVPANAWQAARPIGSYTLVGCAVAPGFDFEDFELLRDLPPGARPEFERFAEAPDFL